MHSNYENKFVFVKGASLGAIYGAALGAVFAGALSGLTGGKVNWQEVRQAAGLWAIFNGLLQGGIEVGRDSAANRVIRTASERRSFAERVDADIPMSTGRFT